MSGAACTLSTLLRRIHWSLLHRDNDRAECYPVEVSSHDWQNLEMQDFIEKQPFPGMSKRFGFNPTLRSLRRAGRRRFGS